MRTNTRTPDEMNERQALAHLRKLTEARDLADLDLADYLLALTESSHWPHIAWADIASAMGVTRQAVQQRVARLLMDGHRRRAALWGEDPNQLRLDDAITAATTGIPPAKGRKS